MNQRTHAIKTMVHLAVLACISQQSAYAGGFSLYTESSAAAIGNFAAGVAAEGADASIGWYNPAGLILLKEQQAVIGGVGVLPSVELTGTSTYTSQNLLGGAPFSYTQSFDHLQGAKNALVPSLHYALPLDQRFVFGLSIVSPFGLSTDYPGTSPVRYSATLSKLQTVNVSPEMGGALTDAVSVGLGLDLQYAEVEYNRMLGSPGAMEVFALPATTIDSLSYNTGHSFAIGFHTGLLWQLNQQHTRFGLNYQSGMNHQFSGYSRLTGRLADPTLEVLDPLVGANPQANYRSNTLISNNVSLPQVVTLSAYQDLNPQWAVLGSVVYFGWDTFKRITLNNVAVGVPVPNEGYTLLTTANSSAVENYRNTWRVALGANYHATDRWLMRAGVGYDETPTQNQERDIRLPDVNRWALSIGTHYQVYSSVGVDFGYTYLFAANNALINNTQIIRTSTNNITATANNNAQLVGVQVVWTERTKKA